MRKSLLLFCLPAVLLLCPLSGEAQTPSLPTGTYTSSCQNAVIFQYPANSSNYVLQANCNTATNVTNNTASQLTLTSCDPTKDVFNDHGDLHCILKAGATLVGSGPVPDGSYLQSCTGLGYGVFSGRPLLRAYCAPPGEYPTQTQNEYSQLYLDTCTPGTSSDISNNNKVLTCTVQTPPTPSGSGSGSSGSSSTPSGSSSTPSGSGSSSTPSGGSSTPSGSGSSSSGSSSTPSGSSSAPSGSGTTPAAPTKVAGFTLNAQGVPDGPYLASCPDAHLVAVTGPDGVVQHQIQATCGTGKQVYPFTLENTKGCIMGAGIQYSPFGGGAIACVHNRGPAVLKR